MVERFTPEIIAIAIVCLTALTLFTSFAVFKTRSLLSKAQKRLFTVAQKCLELEEELASVQQVRQMTSNNVAHLVEVDDNIRSIERRMDEFDHKIAENQNQLTGYESKLKEYDTLLGQAGQMMGKEASGLKQAIQRIRTLEEEFQDLKAFQRTFEQIRNRILNALGATLAGTHLRNPPSPEQKVFREEAVSPSELAKTDLEDLYKSRLYFYSP